MTVYRLRLRLDDSPGRLGDVAAALGASGWNIVDVDVHGTTAAQRVDELLVDVPDEAAADAIGPVLAGVACEVLDVRAADPHELQDVVTRALELATLIVEEPRSDRRLADVMGELVRAEVSCVIRRSVDGVIGRALADETPAQAQEPVKLLPAGQDMPWLLAVPFGLAPRRVMVLARRGIKFTFTETARVQALLRLALASGAAPGDSSQETDAAVIRPIQAVDFVAFRDMHERCSPESLHRRYFGTAPDHVLARLVNVDGADDVGLVALKHGQMIGAAHACRIGPGVAEVAFLVEDAYQRCGVGGLLLDRLSRELGGAGVKEILAVTLPGNAPMMRLMRHAGKPRVEWADGILRMTLRLQDRSGAGVDEGSTR